MRFMIARRMAFTHSLLIVILLCTTQAVWASEEPSSEEIGPIQVLHSEAEAIAEIFDDADSSWCDTIFVSDSIRASLETTLQRVIRDSLYVVYRVFHGGELQGLGIVSEEQGKYRPITFMAGVDTDVRVVDVRVLVYRESRGGEVQHARFLRQYRGKDVDDPIRINRDIINITGATISVRSLNAGVRKALVLAHMMYSEDGTLK